MNEINKTDNMQEEMGDSHENKTQESGKTKTGIPFLNLKKWEVILLGLAFFLIAFVAMPNYFHALETLRGESCSAKLTLLANCVQHLANQNDTQPGKKVCELFDLNELLEQVQGGGSINLQEGDLPMYFKIGTEPDCPEPSGDYTVELFLDEEGNIIPPRCSLAQGEDGEYFVENGLHVANMNKVDGDPFKQDEGSNDS